MKVWLLLFAACFYYSTKLEAYFLSHETPITKYLKPIEIAETRSGLKPIDCIYVINLDERPEKWARMQPIFKEQGLRVNRVSAINGWLLPKKAIWELQGPYRTCMPKGAVGCLLSHVSVLKDAYERGFQIIWVFEDDVEFLEDVKKEIPSLLKKLSSVDPDWDIFYTDVDIRNKKGEYNPASAVRARPDQRILPLEYYMERTKLTDDIMRIRLRYGMHSVLFSKKGVEKVLQYFTHVYVWTPIDIDIHLVPGIRQYAATRDIVIQKQFIFDTSVNHFEYK